MSGIRISDDHRLQAAREEDWAIEEQRREAGRAFRSLRRRGLARRILQNLGLGLPARADAAQSLHADALIAIADIAGLAGEGGRRGLPVLPRALAALWQREYGKLEQGARAEAFHLRQIAGYWHLEGGMRELLRLEYFHARGEQSVPASFKPALSRVERPSTEYSCSDCNDRMAG